MLPYLCQSKKYGDTYIYIVKIPIRQDRNHTQYQYYQPSLCTFTFTSLILYQNRELYCLYALKHQFKIKLFLIFNIT